MVGSFPPHMLRRNRVELSIDERYQLGLGARIAASHSLQKHSHVVFRDVSARMHIGPSPIFKTCKECTPSEFHGRRPIAFPEFASRPQERSPLLGAVSFCSSH